MSNALKKYIFDNVCQFKMFVRLYIFSFVIYFSIYEFMIFTTV